MIPSKIFAGVHFVLVGFDSISHQQVRSRMVEAGGVYVGRYSPDCTHAIVDKAVYDDPICVAARSDGKTLVTALWVYHSFDVGMPVDPALIMYRPLRDLTGIPGAKSLVVCLTGYQGHERDDIMVMVDLMGANFSKPLVANKVTHLICYKFEGMKYDLARQIKRIKLVNHRWLEDCLRTWQILPEDDYDKSGYELDMMEAQAKDSEDEAQDMDTEQTRGKGMVSTSGLLSVSKMEAKPDQVSREGTPVRLLEVPGSFVPGTAGKICTELNSMGRTPLPENVISDLTPASKVDEKSPSPNASKFTTLSYSRKTPRKAILPVESVQTESKAQISVIRDFDNKVHVSDSFSMSSCNMDVDGTTSNDKRSPLKEILSCPDDGRSYSLSEKRKVAIFVGSSKLQRTDNNLDVSSDGVVVNRTKERPPEPSMNELVKVSGHSPGKKSGYADTTTDLNPLKSSPAKVCSPITSEIEQVCSKIGPQISSEKRNITCMDSNPEVKDLHSNRPENAVNDSTMVQNGLQDEAPPPETKVHEVERCNPMVGLDVPGGEASTRSKPLKRKLLAKKTLGSRPSFGRGKALNQKGSIHIKEKGSAKNHSMSPLGQNETEEPGRFISTERVKVVHPTFDAEMDEDANMANVLESRNEEAYKTRFVDDETEATENVEDKELDAIIDNDKPGDIEVPNSVPTRTGEKVGVQIKQTADDIPGVEEQVVDSGDDKLMSEAENAAGKKNEQSESLLGDNAKGERITSGNKFPSTKTRKKNIPVENSGKGGQRKEAKDELSGKKAKTRNAKGFEVKVDKDIIPAQVDMADNSMGMEKENTPLEIGSINVNNTSKKMVGMSTRKSNIKPQKDDGEDSGSKSVAQIIVKTEPIWFILSGHKLQRKDFRQVIRHLKGRVCRDSHQWSYQATHFIAPDPLRRTEKFFAAAASGRWILKTDYLSASNEAGKFLAEEPYEWHKKGLSEDGAINLEAPRNWRLLRERTGHGAFHGMRIIIYGECIAPPLDTLKRVVKAGDGTILATSPPYTRFLQSGVDFAIVSSGMPRVDIWVQEFLRNEIPCVLADYLVDYVCKPGYSLDRHVQYNTLAWAEKSLKNLVTRMEEVVENPTSEENDDDITCQVCGSRDRGEVMLICGDENGSSGCGIGTHIDCCDPPLEEIPQEDWFCPNCRNKNGQNAQKNSRKPISRLKRK
ncbi:BRCT domain-containing protein At4g02110 isoform X1 [Coffea arabica]|uniref:BRCT domain-containing protein At4g02110 isoform X1 n=1 Tax=Coffea arabica TaxID=13443 RepID=A0A6P6WIQ5_COFAR